LRKHTQIPNQFSTTLHCLRRMGSGQRRRGKFYYRVFNDCLGVPVAITGTTKKKKPAVPSGLLIDRDRPEPTGVGFSEAALISISAKVCCSLDSGQRQAGSAGSASLTRTSGRQKPSKKGQANKSGRLRHRMAAVRMTRGPLLDNVLIRTTEQSPSLASYKLSEGSTATNWRAAQKNRRRPVLRGNLPTGRRTENTIGV